MVSSSHVVSAAPSSSGGGLLTLFPAPAWVPHRATGPARSLLQHGLPMESQPASGIHLLWRGVLHRLQGNLCSSAWSTSSPSFFNDLGVCRVVSLASSHSSLSTAPSQQFFFPPLLNYFIPEVPPPLLMGLALARSGSILERAGIGSIRHRGSFWQLLTEATPVAPLLPKPCHTNPI